MPRSAIVPQILSIAGVTPTTVAANAAGNSVDNDGKTCIRFENTGGSPCVVTFDTPITVNGLTVQNPTVTIPATTGKKDVGPFPPDTFNQRDGSNSVYFDYDQVTSVFVGAYRLP